MMINCIALYGICFFVPPQEWEVASPETLSPRVHIAFVGKSSSGLAPTINLATEPVSISLPAYVEAVRKIHTADPNAKWRDLGRFDTKLGPGQLTEIEMSTEQGKARLMQLMVVKGGLAYILTACALKEEFPKHYKLFDRVLQSLQETDDLVESYPAHKRAELKSALGALTGEKQWAKFEQKIIHDFTEIGPYWQILMLSEARAKLLTEGTK